MPYIGRSTEAFGVRTRYTYTPSAGDTSVSGADVNGLSLSFTDGAYVDVFLNGVRLKHNTDYVTTTANTIGSLAALAASDEVEVVVFDVFSLADMVSSANGGNFFGQVNLKTDSGVIGFGADSEITLTHSADSGLKLKNTNTSDNSTVTLALQTGETDIQQNDIIGQIEFQAPDEGTGTDAILVSANIKAVSEGDFSSSSNATSLEFQAAKSGAVGADGGRLTLTSDANLIIKDVDTADGSSPTITLQTGDTDIAQDDVLGTINFQAPDESTGTDAILVAAGISAISEGDFSSSSNATKLSFKTGASEAAAEKMSLSSAGLLTVSGRIITDDTTEATSTTDGSLQTDGGLSVAKDIVAGDDVKLLSDSAVLSFGADSEIQLIHVADDGLILKHTGTGDGKEPSFTFQAGDNDIAQDDVLGQINFQAPDEGAGTDAILVASTIKAFAEGDFSSSSNATTLELSTGRSAAAGSDGGRLRLTSAGVLEFKNQNTADDTHPILHFQTGETDMATSDVAGLIRFSAPDEGAGTDAIATMGEILCFAESDFSSSANASSVAIRTSASGAVDTGTVLRCKSDGDVVIAGNLIMTSGKGMDFSADADQGVFSGGEVFEDYERGTFQMAILTGSGSATIDSSYRTGVYIKTGDLVNCNIHVRVGAISSPSGTFQLTGLPFTTPNDVKYRFSGVISAYFGFTGRSDETPLGVYLNNNSTTLNIVEPNGNSVTSSIADQLVANQSELYVTITYQIGD